MISYYDIRRSLRRMQDEYAVVECSLNQPNDKKDTLVDCLRESDTTSEYTREELLFLKRARRYANNDGRIDAEERTDLEALAMKLGIDELRTEELIEEAFGE